jgi:hypothetical protein
VQSDTNAASTEAPASQGSTTDACGRRVAYGICAAPKSAHEGGALGHSFDAAFPDSSQGEAGELQRLRAMEARAKAEQARLSVSSRHADEIGAVERILNGPAPEAREVKP